MTMDNKSILPTPPSGWVTASPLQFYSSLNELSLLDLIGIHTPWPSKHFFVQFCFNRHTPLEIHPDAYLTFHTRDSNLPSAAPNPCYSIGNINRWRLDISTFRSMDDYVSSLIRWHRCNYTKSKNAFTKHRCTFSLIENDWSEHAENAYRLYANVATRHGEWLYDFHFFKMIAKRPDYKLCCAWYEGKMIGMFVLQEELPTLHSICCGLDYNHSSASCTYSWMHYALIEKAIGSQKYQNFDVGLTADNSKKAIGFTAIPSNMDIYTNRPVTGGVLRAAARFFSATITSEAKLKFAWRGNNGK